MNNIDILLIHRNILKNFEEDKANINKYENEIQKIKKSLNSLLTYRMKKNLENNLLQLQQKIDDINSNKIFNFYIMESTEIIEKYKNILQKPVVFSFFGKRENKQQEKKKINQ